MLTEVERSVDGHGRRGPAGRHEKAPARTGAVLGGPVRALPSGRSGRRSGRAVPASSLAPAPGGIARGHVAKTDLVRVDHAALPAPGPWARRERARRPRSAPAPPSPRL